MLKKLKTNKLELYTIIPFLTIILIITIKIIKGKELLIDKLGHKLLVEYLRTPNITTFMKTITKLSDTSYIIIIAIILTILFLFKMKKKNIAIAIPCNLAFVTLFNQTLKTIFQRGRPIGYNLIEIGGYSFPSGHAMVSMGFYGLLIIIINHQVTNNLIKKILIALNIILILLIGISRVYLGVHYLSDIIVGYLTAIIYLILLAKILKKYKIIP